MAVNYRNGLFNVGSYQVSGYPFVTGSNVNTANPGNGEVKIEFPSVVKNVTIINTNTIELRVYFNASSSADSWAQNGSLSYPAGAPISGHHFITLENRKDSVTFDVKCRELYIAATASGVAVGSFECWAELTGIGKEQMFALTGAGLTDP